MNITKISASALILSLSFALFVGVNIVSAAGVSSVSETMTRQKISEASDHTIVFTTPTGVAAAETITVTFPVGFDLATNSVAFGDMDLDGSVAGSQALALTAATTTWGATVAGQVVTFTSATGTFAAGETITIKIGTVATGGANQIINPATASTTATTHTMAIGGTMADSGSVVISILSDDQVHVSGIVLSELTFELIANSDASDFSSVNANAVDLGNLSSSAVQYATEGAGTGGAASTVAGGAHGVKAGTNAASGYSISVSGTTLTSAASDTITAIGAAAAASAAGTEQFGLCLSDDTTGTSGTQATDTAQQGAIAAAYSCGGTGFAFNDAAANLVATGNASGPTSMTFYDVQYIANITALTESGTYTTDLTWTAVATF